MNFPLETLETHIEETLWLKGELLFEQGKVRTPTEIDRHLWVTKVDDDFEVEVELTPSKVKSCTCECQTFSEIKMCEHVAASLMYLRQQQRNKKEAQKKKTAKKNNNSSKLTTASILAHIDESALKAFVKDYAVRDKNFALALKTRFISKIDLQDNKQKYEQVLEDAIKVARKKDRNISSRGGQKLLKISRELLNQSELAVDQKYFQIAAYINESLIEKLTPILRKVEQLQAFQGIIEQSFTNLQQIVQQPIPPDLLSDIWTYCSAECLKITYRINEILPHFCRLLLILAEVFEKDEELLHIFKRLITQSLYSEKNFVRLIIHSIVLLERMGRLEEANALIQQHIQHPELLLYAIRQAAAKKQHVQVKQLSHFGLTQKDFPRAIKIQLKQFALEVALQEQNVENIQSLSFELTLSSFDLAHFETLKAYSQQRWNATRKQLFKQLDALPYSLQKRDFKAALLAAENMHDDLMEYIAEIKSLDLLQSFDHQLFSTHKAAVNQLYTTLLKDYLVHHLGRKTALRVKEKINHLYNIGENDLADELVDDFRNEYRDRHSLMEELAPF